MLPERLTALPEYAFPRLRALLGETAPGKPQIDFSIGEPKHAPPAFIRPILDAHFDKLAGYPPIEGTESFRAAVRDWLSMRYHLPQGWAEQNLKVLPLNGTREGLFMSVLATTPERKNRQRPAVLLPNPFYQCYAAATLTAGAEPIYLSATQETGFLPSLDLPEPMLERTAAFFLCSPANPQGAVASRDYWRRLLELAQKHDFLIFADECYSEIYRGAAPVGVLQVAAEIGADPNRVLAFHSLSKRSNLAGLRSGFVAGGEAPLAAVQRLKAYGGAPNPLPALHAAEAAWRDEAHVIANRALYAEKFAFADELFTSLPAYQSPEAGFFLWIRVGDGESVTKDLWREDGVKVLPGSYLSRRDADGLDPGAEYIRVALVAPLEQVREGLGRLHERLLTLAS
ncbi:MAG: aminotransferase class I/II-fold pyridoxal phosphate-dependent enzyme [Neomegalonema sp.]|nr:aminotransferase class I/II-fold pyridoxal phosphate-dependent enzyme [Neomegalonema sp.]